jgi:hypothetical protein
MSIRDQRLKFSLKNVHYSDFENIENDKIEIS